MKLNCKVNFNADKFLKKHAEKALKATSEVIPDIKAANEEFMPYWTGKTVDTAKIKDNKLIYTTPYAKAIYYRGGFSRGYFVTAYNNGKPVRIGVVKGKFRSKERVAPKEFGKAKAELKWYDNHAKPKHVKNWIKIIKKTYKDSD